MTEKARAAFAQRFYDQTDPELPPAERLRQAEAARRLHYARLARRSVAARQRLRQAAGELAEIGECLADAAGLLA